MAVLILILICGLLALVYAGWAIRSVLASNAGNARMQEIAEAIREGAQAYLARQYMTIFFVGIVVFAITWWLLAAYAAFGFLIGAVLSGLAGFIGMHVSVRANVRTAQAASLSLAGGLEIAYRAGAVTGMLVAGLALLGVAGYYTFLTQGLGYASGDRVVIDALVALGFGASLISIFAVIAQLPHAFGDGVEQVRGVHADIAHAFEVDIDPLGLERLGVHLAHALGVQAQVLDLAVRFQVPGAEVADVDAVGVDLVEDGLAGAFHLHAAQRRHRDGDARPVLAALVVGFLGHEDLQFVVDHRGASTAGLAGVFFASYQGFVNPSSFTFFSRR